MVDPLGLNGSQSFILNLMPGQLQKLSNEESSNERTLRALTFLGPVKSLHAARTGLAEFSGALYRVDAQRRGYGMQRGEKL